MDKEQKILDLSISIKPEIMFGIFGLALVLSLIMGVIYLYHWRKYSVRGRDIVWAEAIYFLGALALLSLIFTTAFLYLYG